MMFDRLLWHCLEPGKYRHEESQLAAELQPHEGETVLMFITDNDAFRRGLPNKRVCDLLFFHRKPGLPPTLLFVELKGSDVEHAVEQLRNTLATVRDALDKSCNPVTLRAITVLGCAAPTEDKVQRKKLLRELGTLIQHLGEQRGKTVDLRQFLE